MQIFPSRFKTGSASHTLLPLIEYICFGASSVHRSTTESCYGTLTATDMSSVSSTLGCRGIARDMTARNALVSSQPFSTSFAGIVYMNTFMMTFSNVLFPAKNVWKLIVKECIQHHMYLDCERHTICDGAFKFLISTYKFALHAYNRSFGCVCFTKPAPDV